MTRLQIEVCELRAKNYKLKEAIHNIGKAWEALDFAIGECESELSISSQLMIDAIEKADEIAWPMGKNKK